MLTLGGRHVEFHNFNPDGAPEHVLLSDRRATPTALRGQRGYLVRDQNIPCGFGTYVAFTSSAELLYSAPPGARLLILPDEYSYLGEADIIRVSPSGHSIRVMYRKSSRQNFILTTERCNNFCLMCSQPPKRADDSWLVEDILRLIPLIDRSTPELTLTGGEPTLLGDRFFEILSACKSWLPETAIHVLSNGRSFRDIDFAERYANVRHPDLMVGIPLYSDVSTLHDYVVQANGAFDDTIMGILNLKRLAQRVEVRFVVHKQTYARLPMLAEFISRNLRFVDHVALMGLEMIGFTRANLSDLWIDPIEYQAELRDAVEHLTCHHVKVSIYNHQLCLLDPTLWPFARKSISDWKNEYMPECDGCRIKEQCGGFFSSAKFRYSDHIRPFL